MHDVVFLEDDNLLARATSKNACITLRSMRKSLVCVCVCMDRDRDCAFESFDSRFIGTLHPELMFSGQSCTHTHTYTASRSPSSQTVSSRGDWPHGRLVIDTGYNYNAEGRSIRAGCAAARTCTPESVSDNKRRILHARAHMWGIGDRNPRAKVLLSTALRERYALGI